MDNWPRLAILLLTYKRTEYALRTVRGICNHLDYQPRAWYIADDGTPGDHVQQILDELAMHNERLIGYHSERFSPHTATIRSVSLRIPASVGIAASVHASSTPIT